MKEFRTSSLDEVDKTLLRLVQKDAHMTAQDLGEALNLSASQAGRRRQRLEAEGYIEAYTARLCPGRLGLDVQAFVQVEMATHTPEKVRDFAALLRARAEVISVWTLTGEADYLLRVYCQDLSELNTLLHQVLLPHPAVARVRSQIVMDQLKSDAPLPT
jgi:DNA-binding Lrp family transcriptional regulator